MAVGIAMFGGILPPADGQAPQRQNFVVNLGSGAVVGVLPFDEPFLLSGGAGASFLSIDLWYAEQQYLPPTRCSVSLVDTLATYAAAQTRFDDGRHGPPPAQALADSAAYARHFSRARWRQQVRIPADSFRLLAGPIRANTDYTFCYRIVRRPSADDSSRFRTDAVAALTTFVRRLFTEAPGVLERPDNLRAVQRALLAALPPADSVVPAKGSLLDRTVDAQVVADQLRPLIAIDQNRDEVLRSISTAVPAVRDSLYALRADSTTLDLVAATLEAAGGGADADRWGGLLPTARALATWKRNSEAVPGWVSSVAFGYARIDQRTQSNPAYEKIWTADSAAAHLRLVDSTRTLLAGIADYARFLQERPALLPTAAGGRAQPATLRSLEALARHATAARSSLHTQRGNLMDLRTALVQTPAAIEAIASSVTTLDLAIVEMLGTTTAEYVARSKAYISADVGLLYGTGVRQVAPYAGANFYSIAVNKGAPVSRCAWGFLECVRKRLSLTLGLTLNDIAREGETANLFGDQMALVGLGFRFTDYLRATGGGLVFQTFSDDAARTRQITMKPAFSLSIDVDVKSTLGTLGELIAQ